MSKHVFVQRPKHPFIEDPIAPPYSYLLRSRNQVNKAGKPKGIGKLVFQPSKKRYVVLCYDPECTNHFEVTE